MRKPEPWFKFAEFMVRPPVALWFNWRLEGLEHIPPDGPLLVAANHISYFDPVCLGTFVDAAGRQARFLAKSELFDKRWLGWILRNAGQIPVYRETRDAGQALVEAVAAMRDGAAVVIYPEGTTTTNPDFSPMKAKSGVARLAALTGAPVVPVGIWGAQVLFARGKIGPFRRGARVVLRAGPPLHLGLVPGSPLEEVNAARDRVMEAIVKLVDEAREEWTPPAWHHQPEQPPPPR